MISEKDIRELRPSAGLGPGLGPRLWEPVVRRAVVLVVRRAVEQAVGWVVELVVR